MNPNHALIHTTDNKMKEVIDTIESVATSRATVLIQGESGTGKELLARFLHTKSHRSGQPFFAINCAALPEGLLESELFGYEKGAFTGAYSRKIGKFELANNSTFLLDEISEMPLLLQAKLLRVLQEGEIERLGGHQSIKVNPRVVATSNKDLFTLSQQGMFREDLYYRLNVIPVRVPALRERKSDIEYFAQLFVDRVTLENGLPRKMLSATAKKRLVQWSWPGNVRELRNTMERSTLLTSKLLLEGKDILIEDSQFQAPVENPTGPALQAGMTVSEAEKLLILKTLEFTNQNRTKAAELLGISIRTLRNKISEYKGGTDERTV